MLFPTLHLGAVEIRSEAPQAICPTVEQVRVAIANKVGVVPGDLSVTFNKVQELGKSPALHLSVKTADPCGPHLEETYSEVDPVAYGCEGIAQLIASEVADFLENPTGSSSCATERVQLHASLDATTMPAGGLSLGVTQPFADHFWWGLWGTAVAGSVAAQTAGEQLAFWLFSPRAVALAGVSLSIGSKVDCHLGLGGGIGSDLGGSADGRVEGSVWSRWVALLQAQNRWTYSVSQRWALELTLRGHWLAYRQELALQNPTRALEPAAPLEASLALGISYGF